MKNLLSFLFLIAMLLGTSSFSYETLEVNRTELSTAGVQKQKKHKGTRNHHRAKAKKQRSRRITSRSASVGRMVYITPTGSCHHSRTSCPALWRGNYSRISLKEALNEGYRACSRCN